MKKLSIIILLSGLLQATPEFMSNESKPLVKKESILPNSADVKEIKMVGDSKANVHSDADLSLPSFEKYVVDFETSMGKYDPYIKNFYDGAINDIHKWWQMSVGEEKPFEAFKKLEKLYNDNRIDKITRSTTGGIPKVFHHIWIGPRPFPEKYRNWQKTWQSVPGWTYKLWTNKDVENYHMINRDLFDNAKNIGEAADILRMEILYKEGGVYIDTDFECLQPEFFDILNAHYDFYSGITPLDGKAILIANGLVGCVAGHPIVEAYLKNVKSAKTMKGCTGIVMKGPGFFTRMVLQHMNKGYRDILLPPSFFYPLAIYPPKPKGPLSSKQGELAHLMDTEEGREEIKKIVNKPESVAIHWWEGAWVIEDGKSVC